MLFGRILQLDPQRRSRFAVQMGLADGRFHTDEKIHGAFFGQFVGHGDAVAAVIPGEKLLNLLGQHRLGLLLHAGPLLGLGGVEGIDIKQADAGQLRNAGVDVSGHSQIQENQARFPDGGRDILIFHGGVGAGGGADHHIAVRQQLHAAAIVDALAAHRNLHHAAAVLADGDGDMGPGLPQGLGGQLAHFAVADDETAAARKVVALAPELFQTVVHGAGVGGGRLHAGFDLFGGGDGHTEQDFQHRVRMEGRPGLVQRLLDLGENLVLAKNLGAQTAGHTEQVGHGLLAPAAAEPVAVLLSSRPGDLTDAVAQRRLHIGAAVDPQLGPVAGGQQNDAQDARQGGGLLHQGRLHLGGEGEFLADLHGGRRMVNADHLDIHWSISPFFSENAHTHAKKPHARGRAVSPAASGSRDSRRGRKDSPPVVWLRQKASSQ